MKKISLALLFVLACSPAAAAVVEKLDLRLRTGSIGFTGVTIYDDDFTEQHYFDFLDLQNDVWGVPKPYARFTTGEVISFSTTHATGSGKLSKCNLSVYSCNGAFGEINDGDFRIGDGAGQTLLGDFVLQGSANVGDDVSLQTFEGSLVYANLDIGGYVSWDTYAHFFTVVSNEEEILPVVVGSDDVTPVPTPAALPLLVIGFGVLRIFGLRKRLERKSFA